VIIFSEELEGRNAKPRAVVIVAMVTVVAAAADL